MSFLQELLGGAYKEGMTEDEISTALQGIKDGSTAEITKLKNALSKANGEAADYKKQLRAKMSEEEANAVAQKEEHERLLKENADLKRSMDVSNRTASLIGLGYSKELATETATAMVDGDLELVLANQAKFLETHTNSIKAELMRGTHRPSVGSEQSSIDYTKKIEDAYADGRIAEAAYYTRLSQTQGADE